MLFNGFTDCKLQYGYDLPAHTQNPTGVKRGLNINAPYEPFWGRPKVHVFGSGNGATGLSNMIVQCCIQVLRPTGLVQILEQADVADINANILGQYGATGPNQIVAVGDSNGGVLNGIKILIPDAPGIYSPSYSVAVTDAGHGGLWNVTSCFVPNILNVAPNNFPSFGTSLIPCFITSADAIQSLNAKIHFGRYADGNLMTGAVLTNAVDWKTKLNHCLIKGSNTAGLKHIAFSALPAGQAPAAVLDPITMPDFPALNPNNAGYYAWHGGFILIIYTNFTGPTGQQFEIAVTDPACTQYTLVRFVPQDARSQTMLADTTNNPSWQVNIDKFGVLYLFPNNSAGANLNSFFTSYLPMGFGLPTIQYVPPASVSLPCYQTCIETAPTY